MSVLLVTGTGTGVGKTVVTAAVASVTAAAGRPVSVVKVAQTGVPPGAPDGDLAHVHRLSGLPVEHLHELTRFSAALSPEAAARCEGRPGLSLADAVQALHALSRSGPAAGAGVVLAEGAGGLLVRFDATGWTLADLAARAGAPVLLVTEAGLGTLNATALTLEALRARGIPCAGLVIGSWPAEPGLAERSNLRDLEQLTGCPLAGALPAGSGALDPDQFAVVATAGLGPALGGCFDAADFRRAHDLA